MYHINIHSHSHIHTHSIHLPLLMPITMLPNFSRISARDVVNANTAMISLATVISKPIYHVYMYTYTLNIYMYVYITGIM